MMNVLNRGSQVPVPAARAIIHIDMDAFFAAVEIRENPALRGQPVLVGGLHRGVVCAASYEARKFGIHSAMPMVTAQKRCPHAVVVMPRHGYYSAVSQQLFAIFGRYTPLVEGLSLDEAFLDVTGSVRLFGDSAAIAAAICQAIKNELHLTASAGVAPNKFVAKVASDLRKPAGLVVVKPDQVATFLAPLPVERIWGVGKVTAAHLHTLGFRTMGQLAQAAAAPTTLAQTLGKIGPHLVRLAQGIDDRPVVAHSAAKSISAEQTFDHDLTAAQLHKPLLAQALRVAQRLQATPCCGRTVQVKIKFTDFKSVTRRHTQHTAIADADAIYAAACKLLERFALADRRVRLCGVGVTDLQPGLPPATLFPDPQRERSQILDRVRGEVLARFGAAALTRATLIEPFEEATP